MCQWITLTPINFFLQFFHIITLSKPVASNTGVRLIAWLMISVTAIPLPESDLIREGQTHMSWEGLFVEKIVLYVHAPRFNIEIKIKLYVFNLRQTCRSKLKSEILRLVTFCNVLKIAFRLFWQRAKDVFSQLLGRSKKTHYMGSFVKWFMHVISFKKLWAPVKQLLKYRNILCSPPVCCYVTVVKPKPFIKKVSSVI